MKAYERAVYGTPEVLSLKDVERPPVGDGEVLVRVHAVSLNFADWGILTGRPYLVRMMMGGLRKPKITRPGADIAGRVEAIGGGVAGCKPGDAVFGDLSGYGCGGFAEYVSVPEEAVVPIPDGVTFEDAAALPIAGATALQGLRDKAQIRAGQLVLVNGASGGVGSFAVQIAKTFDTEVTAVCSTGKVEMVRSIGADHVIDYTREDFTGSGKQYDLILAANGYHPITAYRRALRPGGSYVATGGRLAQIFQGMLLGPLLSIGGKRLGSCSAQTNRDDLAFLAELVRTGRVKPAIDRRYPFENLPEALGYLGEGHAAGKVVVTVTS